MLPLATSRSSWPRAHRGRLDLFGAAVSCACACHCVALPLVLALVPAFIPAAPLEALRDERVEAGLLAATALVGAASFGPAAWRSAPGRGRWRVPAVFAVGVLLLLASRMLEERWSGAGTDVGVLAGAGMVASAHLVNRRRARADREAGDAARCCPCPDEGTAA